MTTADTCNRTSVFKVTGITGFWSGMILISQLIPQDEVGFSL